MRQLRTLIFLVALTLIGMASPAQADELKGTVQIQLPDGLTRASGDGTIVFRVRQENQATTSVEGQVAGGQYSADIPSGCEIQILATRTTEGAGYPMDRGRWMSLPEDGQLDVIVRIPLDFDLWVYGPDGRTQLQGITIMRSLRKFARLPIPGPADRKIQQIHNSVDSPVFIQIDTPEAYTYYVHAPGHAWTQISPDPYLGGVQTIQLTEGGSLNVQIAQQGVGRGRVLRVRNLDPGPDSHPLVHELKQYEDLIRVVGLPVGRYSVSSEDPIRPWNMPVYGVAEIEIQAGTTAELKLPLSAEPVFEPVPAGGTILIPAQWGNASQLTMRLTRLDPYGKWGRSYTVDGSEFSPVPEVDQLYRWSLPEIAPGAYNLSFDHTSYSVYREVHGAGHKRLHFELPAPRTVTIHTIDDRTGEPIYPKSLLWSSVEPEAIRKKIRDTAPFQSERRFVTRTGDETGFTIYSPDAALRIRMDDPRFDMAELMVSELGDQQVEWKLHRATAIRLVFEHAGAQIDWKGNVHILSESGHGKVLGALETKFGQQYNLSQSGRYSIRFPKLDGFQPIPPQTVQVADGEVLEIKVALSAR
ncbi:MAG: hypothetical protein P1V35_04160 [Planctomycetota bacterium]|nr:hypothetical protein [Planctomycetota bacterium]